MGPLNSFVSKLLQTALGFVIMVILPLALFDQLLLLTTWPVIVFSITGVLVHMVPPHTPTQSLLSPPPHDRGSTVLMLSGYILYGVISFVGYLKTFSFTPCICHWSSMLGVVLVVLGLALRQWTITTMGKYFTGQVVLEKDHPVIIEGPFKYLKVRHPGYLGTLLLGLGTAFVFHSQLSLVLFFVLLLPVYVFRIKVEDEELSHNVGENFKAYMAKTYKLVPYIY